MSHNKKLSKIKSSVFSRSLSLAKLGINAGLKYASTKITNSPLDDFIISQAITVTKELGELKGSLMKAGKCFRCMGSTFYPPAQFIFSKLYKLILHLLNGRL